MKINLKKVDGIIDGVFDQNVLEIELDLFDELVAQAVRERSVQRQRVKITNLVDCLGIRTEAYGTIDWFQEYYLGKEFKFPQEEHQNFVTAADASFAKAVKKYSPERTMRSTPMARLRAVKKFFITVVKNDVKEAIRTYLIKNKILKTEQIKAIANAKKYDLDVRKTPRNVLIEHFRQTKTGQRIVHIDRFYDELQKRLNEVANNPYGGNGPMPAPCGREEFFEKFEEIAPMFGSFSEMDRQYMRDCTFGDATKKRAFMVAYNNSDADMKKIHQDISNKIGDFFWSPNEDEDDALTLRLFQLGDGMEQLDN